MAKAGLSASGKGKSKKATEQEKSPQSKAVQARWDRRDQTDVQVREFFLTCEHGAGLEELQKLRRHVEIAAKAYDENVHRDNQEVCANPACGRQLGPNFPPYHKFPKKDPDTGITRNIMTCSHPCYVVVHGAGGEAPIGRR